MSHVELVSATISVVPTPSLQEVGRLAFTYQQLAKRFVLSHIRRQRWRSFLYFLSKGGYGIVLFDQYCKLHILQELSVGNSPGVHLCFCMHLNLFIFIQFIYYMFYNAFSWSVPNYGIHCLFDIILHSLDYSYFYNVYIVRVSYSKLYCAFNFLF